MVDYSLAHSSRDAFAAYLPAWAKTDFSAAVKDLRLPVKVIVGEHDPALNSAVMQATYLQSYPEAELEVMANAGHYPMHETPVALATSIENFLRR
jgi:pimeloyl-ACP methyl ester carboxylesterase